MKIKLLSICVGCLLLASCAKDRTCTCTTTNSANSNSNTHETTFVQVSKSQAKAQCVSSKRESNGTTYTSNCELK
jgi:uncharacterized lipoprotein YajG